MMVGGTVDTDTKVPAHAYIHFVVFLECNVLILSRELVLAEPRPNQGCNFKCQWPSIVLLF